jgi:ATP-dependent protease HslVU (ClpYQ) peptidase subunit
MTCIVAIQNGPNGLCFAADRREVFGDSHFQVGARPKILLKNGILLGGAGDGNICELILESFKMPKVGKDSFKYMREVYKPKLTQFLVKYKYLDEGTGKLKNPDDENETSLLVGIRGQLFGVSIDNYGVLVSSVSTPFGIGTGSPFALGYLKALELKLCSSEGTIQDYLCNAIKVAANLDLHCDSVVDIIFNLCYNKR